MAKLHIYGNNHDLKIKLHTQKHFQLCHMKKKKKKIQASTTQDRQYWPATFMYIYLYCINFTMYNRLLHTLTKQYPPQDRSLQTIDTHLSPSALSSFFFVFFIKFVPIVTTRSD